MSHKRSNKEGDESPVSQLQAEQTVTQLKGSTVEQCERKRGCGCGCKAAEREDATSASAAQRMKKQHSKLSLAAQHAFTLGKQTARNANFKN